MIVLSFIRVISPQLQRVKKHNKLVLILTLLAVLYKMPYVMKTYDLVPIGTIIEKEILKNKSNGTGATISAIAF